MEPPWWLNSEESACTERNAGDLGSVPGWEDPLEEEIPAHSSILGLENPMDRGAWQAIVHRVAKSQTQL